MGKKRILITGVTGFVGPHLADFLLRDENVMVHGIYRNEHALTRLGDSIHKIILHPCDLTDPMAVENTLVSAQPDVIFHLAAYSDVALSWAEPAHTFQSNVLGTIHLFEAIRKARLNPVIQIACSSEQYGLVRRDELPVNEETAFSPLSPYAVSRVTVDLLGYQYFKSFGMKIIRTRAFNHTGPGQTERFVCSRFAKHIAEIEKGLTLPILKVGNLDAVRDFTDVRDIVRAYTLSVMHGKPGEAYVIASGLGRSIKEALTILVSLSGASIRVETDPVLLRPSDVPILYGDSTKFREATGWKPEWSFEETLRDLLNYWRERV